MVEQEVHGSKHTPWLLNNSARSTAFPESTGLSGGEGGLGHGEQPVRQPPDAVPHGTPVRVHVLGEVCAHGRASVAKETVDRCPTDAYHRGDQAQEQEDQTGIRADVICVQVTITMVLTESAIGQYTTCNVR